MLSIKNKETTDTYYLLIITSILMIMALVLPVKTGVSEITIGHIINADIVEVEAEIHLGYYEDEPIKEEIVTYAALQGMSEEYIDEVEENKQKERERKEQEEVEIKRQKEKAQEEAREVNKYNVYAKTGHTTEEFNRMLVGTGLAGMGYAYEKLENTYGINGVFAIGLAMHESGNGFSGLAQGKNNYYGMKGQSGWMSFSSKETNILYFGELMNKGWYKGKSLTAIGEVYCPVETEHWVNTVIKHMNRAKSKI